MGTIDSLWVFLAVVLILSTLIRLFEFWLRIPMFRLTVKPRAIAFKRSPKMQWYRILPSAKVIDNENEREYYHLQSGDMFSLINKGEDRSLRPFMSHIVMMIRYNADTGTKDLYLGAPYPESTIKGWCARQGVRQVKVDFKDVPFLLPTCRQDLAIAKMKDIQYESIRSTPRTDDFGRVTSLEFAPGGDTMVVLDAFSMYGKDRDSLQYYLSSTENAQAADKPFIASAVEKQISIFANDKTARGICVLVTESKKTGEKADDVMNDVKVRLDATPFNMTGQLLPLNLLDRSMRNSIRVAVLSAIFLIISIATGSEVGIACFATALSVVGLTNILMIAAPVFSTGAFKHMLKHGYVAQPWLVPERIKFYWRRSLRRLAERRHMFGRSFIRIPNPMDRHILPMYHLTMTQFFSFPLNIEGKSSFTKSDAPLVGYPQQLQSVFSGMRNKVFMGCTITGQPVYRDLELLESGVTFAGGAGTGKTNTMIDYYLGVARRSFSNPDGIKITPIWLNTKDTTGEMLRAMFTAFGKPSGNNKWMPLDLENPGSRMRLALEGRTVVNPTRTDKEGNQIPGQYVYKSEVPISRVMESAEDLTAAISALFGSAIQSESKMWLRNIVKVAMLLQPWEICDVFDKRGGNMEGISISSYVGCDGSFEYDQRGNIVYGTVVKQPNLMKLCYILAGGAGKSFQHDTVFQALYQAWGEGSGRGGGELSSHFIGDHTLEWEQDRRAQLKQCAHELITPMVNTRGTGGTDQKMRPIFNKFHDLKEYSALWDNYTPSGVYRKMLPLKTIITSHMPVVINFAGYKSKDPTQSTRVSNAVREQYTALLHTLLWDIMKKVLVDSKTEYYPIFCDEITNLAPMVDDGAARANINGILSDVKDQGRSRGVTHVLGFQHYTQLSDIGVLSSLMGIETMFIGRLPQITTGSNMSVMDMFDVAHQRGVFSENVMQNLPKGTSVAKMKLDVSGGVQTPFFTFRAPFSGDYAKAMRTCIKQYGISYPEEKLYRLIEHQMRREGKVTPDN